MKKVTKLLVFSLVFFSLVGQAFAAPMDFEITHRDKFDTTDVPQALTPPSYMDGANAIPYFQGRGDDVSDFSGVYNFLNIGSGISLAGGSISVTPTTIETTDGHLSDTLTSMKSGIAGNSSNITSLFNNIFGPNTGLLAKTSGNVAGFMTSAESAKLAALSTSTPSISYPSRSIVTGTGAVGTQISTTQGTDVHYNGTIVTTATISGPAQGTLVLEVAPTNSATTGDWKEQGRCTNGQNITLALALNSVQTIGCELSGYVPAGYYSKIRSITTSGSPTFTLNSSFEKSVV